MNIKEAIKILKKQPDFSLRYYEREYAIDCLIDNYYNLEFELRHQLADSVYKEDWDKVYYLNNLLGGTDEDVEIAKERLKAMKEE